MPSRLTLQLLSLFRAAAHLQLEHSLLHGEMVGCMVDFGVVDKLDLSRYKCGTDPLGPISPLFPDSRSSWPTFVHYCASHEIPPIPLYPSLSGGEGEESGTWHFAKRQVPHKLLPSCLNNFLQRPQAQLLRRISELIAKPAASYGTGGGVVRSSKYYRDAKREAFMVCALTEAINSAALAFRNSACELSKKRITGETGNATLDHASFSPEYGICLVPGGWKFVNSTNKRFGGAAREYLAASNSN